MSLIAVEACQSSAYASAGKSASFFQMMRIFFSFLLLEKSNKLFETCITLWVYEFL